MNSNQFTVEKLKSPIDKFTHRIKANDFSIEFEELDLEIPDLDIKFEELNLEIPDFDIE